MSDHIASSEVLPTLTLPNGMRVRHLPKARGEVMYIYREIFEQRTYACCGIDLYSGDCVVDVGANIGLFALFAMQECENLRLVCLEPVPPTFSALQANLLSANTVGHQVDLVNQGVSLRREEVEITFYPSAPGNSTALPKEKQAEGGLIADTLTMADVWRRSKWMYLLLLLGFPFRRRLIRARLRRQLHGKRTFRCKLAPLSDVLDERAIHRVDLLKIDVEGSEMLVLESLRDDQWEGIRQLVVEISPHLAGRVPSLRSDLMGRGFDQVSVVEPAGTVDGEPRSLPCTLYARRSGTPASR